MPGLGLGLALGLGLGVGVAVGLGLGLKGALCLGLVSEGRAQVTLCLG